MEWTGLALTILGGLVTAVTMWTKLGGRVDNVETDLETAVHRYDKHHTQHFDHARKGEASEAMIGQRLSDHEKHDDNRFEALEGLAKETRDDVKKLIGLIGTL